MAQNMAIASPTNIFVTDGIKSNAVKIIKYEIIILFTERIDRFQFPSSYLPGRAVRLG